MAWERKRCEAALGLEGEEHNVRLFIAGSEKNTFSSLDRQDAVMPHVNRMEFKFVILTVDSKPMTHAV